MKKKGNKILFWELLFNLTGTQAEKKRVGKDNARELGSEKAVMGFVSNVEKFGL